MDIPLQVIAANKEARKPDAILDCDGDTFLKNECRVDKWVIIELSQIVKPTTLVLSQVRIFQYSLFIRIVFLESWCTCRTAPGVEAGAHLPVFAFH